VLRETLVGYILETERASFEAELVGDRGAFLAPIQQRLFPLVLPLYHEPLLDEVHGLRVLLRYFDKPGAQGELRKVAGEGLEVMLLHEYWHAMIPHQLLDLSVDKIGESEVALRGV
jgi:hypothetical protein